MMERALKERIVGATVLVLVAVLVVPVFLDGPSQQETVITQSVTLPGQNDQPRKQQTIVLERDRSEPVPATPLPEAETSAVETPRPEPAKAREAAEKVTASEAQPAPPAAGTESPPKDPGTGLFAVQLGSFQGRLRGLPEPAGYRRGLAAPGSRGAAERSRVGRIRSRAAVGGRPQRPGRSSSMITGRRHWAVPGGAHLLESAASCPDPTGVS